MVGQGHDRHTAHGMTDEDDVTGGSHGIDDMSEIYAEAVDRGAGSSALRCPVATLIPQHHTR